MCDALQINWKLPSSLMNTKNLRDDSKGSNKYTLRACSIKKRAETESRKSQPRKRGPKPRPKPLPMSKYRRKTANLRERQRMGEINVAFDKLRDKIPSPSSGSGRCEKMTKINILHVAINYIKALESILDTGDAGIQIYGTSLIQSPRNSSSPPSYDSDSGIVDEDEEEEENIHEPFPEWNELTSTLDFEKSKKKTVLNNNNNNSISYLRQNSNSSIVSLSELLNGGLLEESPLFSDLNNSSFESLSDGIVEFSHDDPFDNILF